MMPTETAIENGQISADGNPELRLPKLVLHFDIRNTMIVADTVTNITVEQALNAYLTGVLWGKEVRDDLWEWASTEPTLLSPVDGTTTFYKHLERMIVKTPLDRVSLRRNVGDFVHTDLGSQFIHYYTEHLELLEWHHSTTDSLMTLQGRNGKWYHYVLPAVYQLIQHLHDSQRDFSVVIRTYGLDCGNVLNSMNYSLKTKNHPQFPFLPDMQLHRHAGHIHRDSNSIKLQVSDGSTVVKELGDETQIYEYLCNTDGICGFKDDFPHWQDNSYNHKCAKPLWIDPNDRKHLHIFFDDNYRPNNIDSIVDVRERDQNGKWRSLDMEAMEKYDNMSLVQVDLLKAIANDNYFIEKVRDCEKKYLNSFSQTD